MRVFTFTPHILASAISAFILSSDMSDIPFSSAMRLARFIASIPLFDDDLLMVSWVLSHLPKEQYTVSHNVMLQTERGTSQVDHVVVSV